MFLWGCSCSAQKLTAEHFNANPLRHCWYSAEIRQQQQPLTLQHKAQLLLLPFFFPFSFIKFLRTAIIITFPQHFTVAALYIENHNHKMPKELPKIHVFTSTLSVKLAPLLSSSYFFPGCSPEQSNSSLPGWSKSITKRAQYGGSYYKQSSCCFCCCFFTPSNNSVNFLTKQRLLHQRSHYYASQSFCCSKSFHVILTFLLLLLLQNPFFSS